MKNYLNEFKESISSQNAPKKLDVNFAPEVNWLKDKQAPPEYGIDSDGTKNVPSPKNISSSDVKSFAAEVVLNFLNEAPEPQGPPEHKLDEKHKREIEAKLRQAMKNPGYMSVIFGEDRDDDKSYLAVNVDPTGKHDWARVREQILYTLPYEYRHDLQEYVTELMNKIKKEVHPKNVAEPVDKEKAMENLRNAMKIDWYADYSDSMAIRRAGETNKQTLLNALLAAAKADPEMARAVAKQEAPKSWHQWIDQIVDKSKMT